MARYGYARCSTIDQDLSIQLTALEKAGCDIIRSEKVSGTSRNGRDELNLLLQFIRKGDTLVVTASTASPAALPTSRTSCGN